MKRILASFLIPFATCGAANFPSDLLKKPDAWYVSAEGRETTACVLSWQTKDGIWPKAADTARAMKPGNVDDAEGTFDNKSTTDELRFLTRAYAATRDEDCKNAFLRGFDLILKAQYESGGWPQVFPPGKKAYPSHITFNDDTMVRLMRFLGEVAVEDRYSFVGADRRIAASAAVARGWSVSSNARSSSAASPPSGAPSMTRSHWPPRWLAPTNFPRSAEPKARASSVFSCRSTSPRPK